MFLFFFVFCFLQFLVHFDLPNGGIPSIKNVTMVSTFFLN